MASNYSLNEQTIMTNFKLYLSLILSSILFISCSRSDSNEEDSILNTISLKSDSPESSLQRSIEFPVKMKLAFPAKENTTFKFKVDRANEFFKLSDQTIIIKKGEKEGSTTITLESLKLIKEVEHLYLSFENISTNFRLAEPLKLTIRPIVNIEFTEKQLKLIDGYQKKYNIDILKFLGELHCEGVVAQPWSNESINYFSKPRNYEINGNTRITLSDLSTEDTPVLKFITNPMGLSKIYAEIYSNTTILDRENWINDANPTYTPGTVEIAKAIDWTPASNKDESYDMTLDGVSLNLEKRKIDFIQPLSSISSYIPHYINESLWNLEIMTIPFVFKYSVWDKLNKLSNELEGFKGKLTQNYVCPYQVLYASGSLEDEWGNTPSDFSLPAAHIDLEEGSLNFDYCFDFGEAGGYNHVTVKCRKIK